MIRRTLRNTIELAATATGLSALARRASRDSIAILAYHNVTADHDARRGDASLHLPLSEFVRQIEHLSRTHDIVDLDTAAHTSAGNRPRAVITFDDAYRGAVTLAFPELVRRGLPAVVFVAPAMLDTRSTWWDELAEAGRLSDTLRDDALTTLAGRGPAIREAFACDAVPVLPASYGIASLEELSASCGDAIAVGSHTWAHEYLPALTQSELRDNLARTLEWLDTYDGLVSRWLALPYGGGSSDTGHTAVSLGHAGVLRISGGLWRSPRTDLDLTRVPRINVPAGVSLRGLEMRTSGLRR